MKLWAVTCNDRHGSPLQPSSYYTYLPVYQRKIYVLPTQCICVFCMDDRADSDYFIIQEQLILFLYPRGSAFTARYDFNVDISAVQIILVFKGLM